MKRFFAVFLMLVLLVPRMEAQAQTPYTHDIIIYGAGFGGVAAALNAQDTYRYLHQGRSARILLINPQSAVGGLGAINGQNFWDWHTWNYVQPQAGHHRKFINGNGTSTNPQFDQFYSTSEMSSWLNTQLTNKGGITILQPYDVKSVSRNNSTGYINSVVVQKLKRENQSWLFDTATSAATYSAPVFIDASESGRFTRLSNLVTTTGRQAYNSDKRQMVATLMFKAKGINRNELVGKAGWWQLLDKNQHVGFGGGNTEINQAAQINLGTASPSTSPLYWLAYFNKTNSNFQIKAMNVAEDRYSNAVAPTREEDRVYWINTLLIVNVDSACELRDGCQNWRYDAQGNLVYSVDGGFIDARQKIGSPEFQWAMQSFPGFSKFEVLTINVGGVNYPVTGESLYLRETIHTPLTTSPVDDNSYALTGREVYEAGSTMTNGTDAANCTKSVGLGYYPMDTNGYTKSNPASGLLDKDVYPSWMPNVYPPNPVCIPIDAILTNQAPNLIIPGYSANVSPWAWTAMRVLPNLTVMGDAAGVLAAYSLNYATAPLNFAAQPNWITNVRTRIAQNGGRVSK